MFSPTSPAHPRAFDRQIRVKGWQVMFSLLLAGLAVKAYIQRFDAGLTSFDDRTIGIAVLTGVDASARTFAYFGMIAAFSLVVMLGITLLAALQNRVERSFRQLWFEIDQKILFTLSTIAFFILLLGVLSRKQIYEHVILILLFLIALDLLVVAANIAYFKVRGRRLRLFESQHVRFLGLCFPMVVIFISWVALKRPFIFRAEHYVWFVTLWLSFFAAYAVLERLCARRILEKVRLDRALVAAGIPFILIPASIPLSNELQFTISHISAISSRQLSGTVIAVLLLISGGLFIYLLRKPGARVLPSKIVQNLYFPILIATCVIFLYHRPVVVVSEFDMFHDGESLIVAQQAFELGLLPYIDQLPTHGLSEAYPQFLYAWVNGYRPIEVWLWTWFNVLLAFLLIYFLLKTIIDPLSALLVTALLPVTAILPLRNLYAVLIFPALGVLLLRKQGREFGKYALLWLVCILALFWRLDFGIAATIASLFVVGVDLLQKMVVKRIAVRTDFVNAIAAFGIGFGALSLFFIVAALLSRQSVQDFWIKNFHFIKILAPAMSFPGLSRDYSALVLFQYGVLPGMAIFYLVYCLYKVFLKREQVTTTQLVMVFLAVVSLLMSFRSLQRHSLLERYDPYLFGFLFVALPFYIHRTPKNTSFVLFTALLFGYTMVFPHFDMLLETGEFFKFRTWRDKESRIQVSPMQSDQLVSFLTQELGEGQTFYDLSNSPMLYVLARKRLVTAVVPNLLTTSETIQQAEVKRLDEAYRQNTLPFIVFRQGNWWDFVDNVPNEVRSYRIAEFIYAHYQPFASIGGYMVWADKDIDISSLMSQGAGGEQYSLVPIEAFSQEFILMKLPYIWGNFDEGGAALLTDELAVLVDKPIRVDPAHPMTFPFNPRIDKTSGNYIHLRIQAQASATLTLSYGAAGGSRIIFDVLPSEGYEDYLVRISTQWEWVSQPVETLEMAVSAPVQIERLSIKRGD